MVDSVITEVVVFDCECFRLYKGGRVERVVGTEDTVPAGFDADTGVASKDVVIDAATGAAARLFLPTIPKSESDNSNGTAPQTKKLPILVFFHGGYFVVGSPTHPWFHRYGNMLAAAAGVLVVSVRYRLAPEHALPAAYDDAWTALNWATSGAAADPWLSEHGDLDRVFVVGVSAGANIAHNVAIAAGVSGLRSAATLAPQPRVEGVILFHPSFASEQKMEEESEEFCRGNRIRWEAIFPDAKYGLDDPRINPMADGAPSLAKLAGERLLVCTTSEDPRAPRGRAYRDAVRASGWHGKVDWFESNGEGHGFFIPFPVCSEAVKLMERVVAFVAGR